MANAQGLFTPEAFYPLTGIKDLTPNVSVAEGVTILESAIKQQVDAGNNVAVVGFSQSSIISSLCAGSTDARLDISAFKAVAKSFALSSIQSIQPSSFSPPPITNVANTLASAISTSYAVLLPTADFVTAAVVSVPAYDLHLFANAILQALGGDPYGLVRAIGDPIAADTALFSIAAGFEAIVLINAAQSIIRDLSGLT
ncbi:putative PPE family protein PPE42 [Mycobacterium simulans]|uniref:PE-PPE domain-containing protein n=1 Tax=Mycobacterium simulans TaxID=627089 RepID=UPI0019CE7B87|nr:PE-PPE domain-containing protein [Mycobacterium simulans]SON61794.1 putative PPE family protein PPE42 [Mycobacterium simulans]